MEQKKKRKIPIIVGDLDGCMMYNNTPIDGVANSLKILNKKLGDLDQEQFKDDYQKIPFLILTNRGGDLEKQVSQMINNAMNFQYPDEQLKDDQIILNFTPLRKIIHSYKDKLILICGGGDQGSIIESCGTMNYITIQEYCTIFSQLVPVSVAQYRTQQQSDELKPIIKKRLGLKDEDFLWPFQVHAIFILLEPVYWDESIQVILDLVSTENGIIAQKLPEKGPASHIPIYCSLNDIMFKSKFVVPRMVNGCFISSLKLLHRKLYNTEIKIEFYGKPQIKQFQFVEQQAKEFLDKDHEISNIYMIGDNPSSDIRGANEAGWNSILVKTGIFQIGDNSIEYPAKYVVKDFSEAIKLIFKIENINYDFSIRQ